MTIKDLLAWSLTVLKACAILTFMWITTKNIGLLHKRLAKLEGDKRGTGPTQEGKS